MGLFKKFKKDKKKEVYEVNSEPEKIVGIKDVKTKEEIKKEQLENIITDLENTLNEKNKNLRAIIEKIQLSKNEYEQIVSKLIQSKKELHSENNVKDRIPKSSSKDDMSTEINNSKITLQKIQDEIIKNKKINNQLEEQIKKNEPFVSDSVNQKKKIDDELNQRQKELEVLKKRLDTMKKEDLGIKGDDDSKSVVEAASQIIATTNKRLQDTMKELEVIRQLLDKERKAHTETKKKLQY